MYYGTNIYQGRFTIEKERKDHITCMCSCIIGEQCVVTRFHSCSCKSKKPALSKKKLSVKIGKSAKLSVKRAKGWKISWKSKNKKIATVKKAGKYAAKITAKKKGTVKITATVKKGKTRRILTCKVTVSADGSVTVKLEKQYGGGGIGFYMDASKSMVDLSDYSKVIFKLSADAEAPICLRTHDTTDYWGSNSSTLLSYTSITTEQKEYICDLSTINSTLGFGVKYNPGGSAALPEEINLTIHSISFIKDTRDTSDAMNNYTSLAEMAAAYGLKMGTVMNERKVADKKYGDLMKYHFNSITAANEMKAAGMLDWFFREGYDSSKPYAKTEVIKARLQNYIEQVLLHFEEKYPGVIYCWDVVNEAVGDSDTEYEEGDERHVRTKRNNEDNPFYTLVGRDYVELSFQYTYEVLQELKKTMPTKTVSKLADLM